MVGKRSGGQFLDAFWERSPGGWFLRPEFALASAGGDEPGAVAGIVLVVAGPVINGKGFGKITGIFGSLYNHVTGYFGDILSYSRLMALMLSGSVIAQVFNTLGAHPRQRGGVLHRLHGGKRPELRAESAGLLRP